MGLKSSKGHTRVPSIYHISDPSNTFEYASVNQKAGINRQPRPPPLRIQEQAVYKNVDHNESYPDEVRHWQGQYRSGQSTYDFGESRRQNRKYIAPPMPLQELVVYKNTNQDDLFPVVGYANTPEGEYRQKQHNHERLSSFATAKFEKSEIQQCQGHTAEGHTITSVESKLPDISHPCTGGNMYHDTLTPKRAYEHRPPSINSFLHGAEVQQLAIPGNIKSKERTNAVNEEENPDDSVYSVPYQNQSPPECVSTQITKKGVGVASQHRRDTILQTDRAFFTDSDQYFRRQFNRHTENWSVPRTGIINSAENENSRMQATPSNMEYTLSYQKQLPTESAATEISSEATDIIWDRRNVIVQTDGDFETNSAQHTTRPLCKQSDTWSIAITKEGGILHDTLNNGEEICLIVPEGAVDENTVNITVTSTDEDNDYFALPQGTQRESVVLSFEPHNMCFNEHILVKFKARNSSAVLLYSNTRCGEEFQWVRADRQQHSQDAEDIDWWISEGACYVYMKHFCFFCLVQEPEHHVEHQVLLASLFGLYEDAILRLVVAFQGANKQPQHSEVNQWGHQLYEQPFIISASGGNLNVKVEIRALDGTPILEEIEITNQDVLMNIESLPSSASCQFLLVQHDLSQHQGLVISVLLTQQLSTQTTKMMHVYTLGPPCDDSTFSTINTIGTVDSGFSTGGSRASRKRVERSTPHFQKILDCVKEQKPVVNRMEHSDEVIPKRPYFQRDNTGNNQRRRCSVKPNSPQNTTKKSLLPLTLATAVQNKLADLIDPHYITGSKLLEQLHIAMGLPEIDYSGSFKSPTKVLLDQFLSKNTNNTVEHLKDILRRFGVFLEC